MESCDHLERLIQEAMEEAMEEAIEEGDGARGGRVEVQESSVSSAHTVHSLRWEDENWCTSQLNLHPQPRLAVIYHCFCHCECIIY